jgi:hypothetical protein
VIRIGCVVEGHGEVQSVPILVRRIAQNLDPGLILSIPHPIRISKMKLLRPNELERAVRLAALNVEGDGGILVVLDSDDDCPAQLAPMLQARIQEGRPDLPSAIVLAKCEFETWFLASAESLRGHRTLAADLQAPPDPEAIRGAKEWLEKRSAQGRYAPTVDQASFAATFDLALARRAPSFDKCYRAVTELLENLRRE